METSSYKVTASRLYSPMGLLTLEVHHCCSALVVTFGKCGQKDSNSLFEASFFQFLDDPRVGHRLLKQTTIAAIAPLIRFSFNHPDTLQCNSQIYLESFGVGLSDILLNDCSFFEKKFPTSEYCIHCMVKNNYADWNDMFPALKGLPFGPSSLLLKYSDFLSKYDDAVIYDNVFALPLESDTTGKYKGVVGLRDYVSFADIGIEKRYWKVFWLAVARMYPGANRRIWFNLKVHLVHGPIDGWRVNMDTMIKFKPFSRFVVVPFGSNIWSAIVYLFIHAPPNSESCKVFPIDAFN